VLKVPPDATLAQAEAAYRALAKSAHPDHGGSDEAMARLNDAIATARKGVVP
jgi:curved DNA-binding protein CbpA